MAQFVAFELIPILAALWIAGGTLVLAIEMIGSARAIIRGEVVRTAVNVTLVGLGFLLLTLGLAFRAMTAQEGENPRIVLLLFGGVSLLGAIVALFFLWPGLRRRN
jgi:hypothetical protein